MDRAHFNPGKLLLTASGRKSDAARRFRAADGCQPGILCGYLYLAIARLRSGQGDLPRAEARPREGEDFLLRPRSRQIHSAARPLRSRGRANRAGRPQDSARARSGNQGRELERSRVEGAGRPMVGPHGASILLTQVTCFRQRHFSPSPNVTVGDFLVWRSPRNCKIVPPAKAMTQASRAEARLG